MRGINPNRTDHLNLKIGHFDDGIKYSRIFNNEIYGFCYDYNMNVLTHKEAIRIAMTILKTISFKKRLKKHERKMFNKFC